MLYYLAVIREYLECNKYKKLYEVEKEKYEELKQLTEELVFHVNPDFLKDVKVINLQSK